MAKYWAYLFYRRGAILSSMSGQRKPRVRKGFLIGLAATLVAVAAAACLLPTSFLVFVAWISAADDCPSVCKGYLGHNLAPGAGHPTYTPTCIPADFRLELHDARIKAGERYPLWYRAELRNTSCFALQSLSADDLINGPRFKVQDSVGNDIAWVGQKWNDIIPYSYDRDAFAAMKNDPALDWSVSESFSGMQWFHIRLDPGRSVKSLPSMILPSMNWLQPHKGQVDLSVQNDGMRRLIEPRLRGKKIARPPPGYAVVNGYKFNKPGRYRIQAEYWGTFRQVHIHSRYERYQRFVPGAVREGLDSLAVRLYNRRVRPNDPDYETQYDLRIKSNSVEFEVVR